MRLYFWFRGVPADRIGGPWWYRDFPDPVSGPADRARFLRDLRPFVRAYVETDGTEVADPFTCAPPGTAPVTWP